MSGFHNVCNKIQGSGKSTIEGKVIIHPEFCLSTHDEKEIAQTAALLENCRKDLTAMQFRLEEKTREMEQVNQEVTI